jgi:hypothetical protein
VSIVLHPLSEFLTVRLQPCLEGVVFAHRVESHLLDEGATQVVSVLTSVVEDVDQRIRQFGTGSVSFSTGEEDAIKLLIDRS